MLQKPSDIDEIEQVRTDVRVLVALDWYTSFDAEAIEGANVFVAWYYKK
jgi:hypothetical protein